MDEVAATLDDHDQRRTSGRTRRRRRQPMTGVRSRRAARRRVRGHRARRLRPRHVPARARGALRVAGRTRRSSTTSARSRCPACWSARSSNRLACLDWIATHPEVRTTSRSTRRSSSIGMFRAGTTLLSRLLRPGPAQPARCSCGRRATACRRRRRPTTGPARGSTPCTPATRCSPRSTRRSRWCTTSRPTRPTECITVMAQDFKSLTYEAIANVPVVRRVAARRRPPLGLRVPPHGAAGAAERRGAGTLDAEEPAPRHRARRAHRGLPRRPARAAAPRPGRAQRVGVQPDQHAVVDVHRRRPPRLHRGRTGPTMLEESVRRIDAFRDAHPEHPIVDVQYADLVTDPRRHRARRSTRAVGDELDDAGRARDRASTSTPTRAASSARTATTSPSTASTPASSPSASPRYTDRYAVPRERYSHPCVDCGMCASTQETREGQRVSMRGRWRMPVWRLLRVHSMSPAGSIDVEPGQQLLVHHPHLEAGEAGAEAEVQAVTEAEVQVGVAGDVERRRHRGTRARRGSPSPSHTTTLSPGSMV